MKRLFLSTALAIAAPASAQQPTWPIPFNTCPNLQIDAFGASKCPGYIDSDNSWIMPDSIDPKLIPFQKAPLNFQRMKIEENFLKPALEPWWATVVLGSGWVAIDPLQQSHACIHTGLADASGAELVISTIFAKMPFDAWGYFFLEVQTTGAFDLQFGFRNQQTPERVMIRRSQVATQSPWQAFVQNAAGQPIGVYSSYGADAQRRIGIITLKDGVADFYIANSLNRFDQAAPTVRFTTNLPSSTSPLSMFIRFVSVGANAVDQIACISKVTFSQAE